MRTSKGSTNFLNRKSTVLTLVLTFVLVFGMGLVFSVGAKAYTTPNEPDGGADDVAR